MGQCKICKYRSHPSSFWPLPWRGLDIKCTWDTRREIRQSVSILGADLAVSEYLRICKRKHKLKENGENVEMPIALIKWFNYAFYYHPFNNIKLRGL